MATRRLLLINGAPIANDNGNPIFELSDKGKRSYVTRHDLSNQENFVMQALEAVMAYEASNPLSQVLEGGVEHSTLTNENFKLRMIDTPLYNLQKQLSVATLGKMRLAGTTTDLSEIWQEQQIQFFTTEFFKYAKLLPYLENAMNSSLNRPSNPSLACKRGEKVVMHLVHAKIDNLYNPLDAFKFLKDTVLFAEAYNDNVISRPIDLREPKVFKTVVVKESTEALLATSCDILTLCGVDHKEILSSTNLYRLIAAICLKSLGAAYTTEMTRESLYFPIGRRFYEVFDVAEGGAVVDRFTELGAANRFADENDLLVRPDPIDSDVMYAKSAFKKVTDGLIDMIRGAEFV